MILLSLIGFAYFIASLIERLASRGQRVALIIAVLIAGFLVPEIWQPVKDIEMKSRWLLERAGPFLEPKSCSENYIVPNLLDLRLGAVSMAQIGPRRSACGK